MTLRRNLNKVWMLVMSIFFATNVALANHHEEAAVGDVNLEKLEQHKASHREKRVEKRDRKSQHRAMRMHDRLDKNEDGKVDLNEYLTHAESRFNEMDADSDQFVTDEEAKQHHKSMREKHRDMRNKGKRKGSKNADEETDK